MDIPPEYNPLSSGHVDMAFCYIDGEWEGGLIPDDGSDPDQDPENERAIGDIVPTDFAPLLIRDKVIPGGARRVTPVGNIDLFGNDFGFIGVGGDSPYWLIPSSGSQQDTVPFLGFAFCADNDCGEYVETDPRVSNTNVRAWITFELLSVDYFGESPTPGEFSVYTRQSNGQFTHWMTTSDGIGSTDKFLTLGHRHGNLAFSQLGLYSVKMQVFCYEGPGMTNKVTSPEVTFRFAVGTYWSKIAEYFPPEYWDQLDVIGSLADPDEDFIPNVIEIATGLNPNLFDADTYDPATEVGLPAPSNVNSGEFIFSDWATTAASQIDVEIESSVNGIDWNALTSGVTSTPLGTDGTREARTWSGQGNGPQLFRIKGTLLPSITY
ncbi:MAG: hypothetical protein AAGA58_06080 [Verrucomicrobiota bacterium]